LETAQSDEAKEMARHEGASTYLPLLPASLLPLTSAVPYLSFCCQNSIGNKNSVFIFIFLISSNL
jgi:hypothetical protein